MQNPASQYDVAILGWWYGKNYGSILTYYGLNRAIEDLGFSTLMVHEPLGFNGYRVKWPDDILSMDFARRMGYHFTAQEHYSELPKLNAQAKNFVVGSDQLWNPLIGRVNDDLFLNFVEPQNHRIAYGTSFGNRDTKKFKPEFIARHRENLDKFRAISVREDFAPSIAKNVFGVNARQVVDPVFLLPQSHYEELASKATVSLTGDYLALFFLDPSPEKIAVALGVAEKLRLDRIVVIPNPDKGREAVSELFSDPRFEILSEDRPENFLHTYANSRYVLTDSFHGTAFAVIFRKPFSSIYNTKRGVDRFKSLLGSLGFGDSRKLTESDSAEQIATNKHVSFDIDYTTAIERVATMRRESLDWLKSALVGPALPAEASRPKIAPQNISKPLVELQRKLRDLARGTRDKLVNSNSPVGRAALRLTYAMNSAGQEVHADPGRVDLPQFTASSNAWQIIPQRIATRLTVAPGEAIRGNLVWCDLPTAAQAGKAYRLTITWAPRSSGNGINLHLRNPSTGKFRVVGTVSLADKGIGLRTDEIVFPVSESGYSQFMLGAIHFTGPNGGTDVVSLTFHEIPASELAEKSNAPPNSHAEMARKLTLADHKRFANAHAKSQSSRSITGSRARMMFHAHAIEKGLSRVDFRAGFGKISVPGLAKEMNSWIDAGRSSNDPYLQIAAAVMRSYFERHASLKSDVSEFRSLFADRVQQLIEATNGNEGGVLSASEPREELITGGTDRNFIDLIYDRRSVRDFIDRPVSDSSIERAVRIAMQAPSVCNRQGPRVHMFRDPEQIKAAVDLQGGFGGYAPPPRLLLVTSDLNAFLFAAERNQPFVDGGLFMMMLLLGLTHQGFGSCSLNTAMGTDREEKLRTLLNIPDNEVFISFVAVGHYDPKVLVPRSARMPLNEVLIKHEKR